MKKLWLIISHEYMTIVGKKSFIIMTLLIPFLMVIIGAVPALFAYVNQAGDSHLERIAVIDESAENYGSALADTDNYKFVVLKASANAANPRDFYKKAGEGLSAVVVIPENVNDSHEINIYSEETLSASTEQYILNALNDTLTSAKIAGYNIEGLQQILDECDIEIDAKSIKWDKEGNEQRSSTTIAVIIGLVLSLVTYMFVLMYGAMIMNSVVEEKTNRIVEVIVSSCKPIELMFGKIIGVGLVGLTQFAIWVVLLGIGGTVVSAITMGSVATPDATSITAGMNLPGDAAALAENSEMADIMQSILSINFASIIFHFIIYFIGGYLLYASLFAAFGSAVDQASDASQFTTPVILLMIVALYAGIGCIENPNGPLAEWCSIIPFTSPVVMMIRLPYDVPLWQQALSILLLFLTAGACVWFAARVYRTGILMYGKKRTFRDIIKWSTQA